MSNYDVGIHHGIAAEEYHADRLFDQPSLSRSVAWEMVQNSALHGWLQSPRLNPEFKPRVSTGVMDFGSCAHALLLNEADRIDVGHPDWKDMKKDAAKEFAAASRAKNRIPVLAHNFEKAQTLVACAMSHLDRLKLREHWERSKPEATVLAKIDGLPIRCRFDRLLVDFGLAATMPRSEIAVAFDVKITGRAHPRILKRHIGQQGYDLQEVFYKKVLSAAEKTAAGKTLFLFLFIEDEFPHCVVPMALKGSYAAIGEHHFNDAWAKWKLGMTKEEWPGIVQGEGWFEAEAPKYLEMQIQDEDES